MIMEPSTLNTSSIRDKMHGIADRAVRRIKERYFTSFAAIRSGWKMVGWFCGRLLLSAKSSRPPGRRENTSWKTIWRTNQRSDNSCRSNGWISSDFNARLIKTSSIWQERYCLVSFLALSWSRGEFGTETFWLRTWKIWKIWTHQKFILEGATRKKYW